MLLALLVDTNDPAIRTWLHSWLRINPDHPQNGILREAMFEKSEQPASREEEE